jgi:ATP-dependent Clp protease protease subunit
MPASYIRFMAPVNSGSAMSLMKVIDSMLAGGARQIHLMLSSPGGSVFHGLSIHNFLRGAPIEVTTYNFGTVDSIATVIFCSGTVRKCVPHARFLIHGVSFNVNGPAQFDEKGLEEHLKLLKIDYGNIARVIADTTQKTTEDVVNDMNERTTLSPEEAKGYGLVHEISPALFPSDCELAVIHEDNSVRRVFPMNEQLPLALEHQSAPLPEMASSSSALSHSSYWA